MSEAAAETPPGSSTMDIADALVLLTTGDLEISGRLVEASNTTLYCTVTLDGVETACVYKPIRGERPLWDFPDGTLAGREVAAYLISQASGWDMIPPTVLRDGPLGPGMCQLWIDSSDVSELVDIVPAGQIVDGWRPVIGGMDPEGREVVVVHANDDRLRRLAVLDVVMNNADRKGGHLLLDTTGHLYGVDHGICFHTEDKLRTLLWGWSDEELTEDTIEVLSRLESDLAGPLGDELHEYVGGEEIAATSTRVAELLRTRTHPGPGRRRHAVPWPPF